MKNQKRIDFIGIGAQKSGTTWLFSNLKQLKEFNLLPIKEVHYFDRSNDYPSPNFLSETLLVNRIKSEKYFSKAIKNVLYHAKHKNFNLSKFYFKWHFSNYSDKWYLSLFKDIDGFTGEITPSYSILRKEDIVRIHNLLPDVKLVLLLRNPIDRAWSHYRFNKGKTHDFNLDRINNEDVMKFMESESQLLRSDYIRTIDNYLSVFPKEQLLICFYDAISDNPEKLLKDILKHICGDETIKLDGLNLKRKVNKSRDLKCPKEVEDYLKNKYYKQIKHLSENYGGYFTKWYRESYLGNSILENIELLPTMYMKS